MLALPLLLAAAQVAAPPVKDGATVQAVLACRAVADSAQRLACFERSAAALEVAIGKRDVVVISNSEVRETRRSLFGFNLPRLGIFGGNPKDEAPREERELTAKLRSARAIAPGRWRLVLESGAVWETVEALPYEASPRAGGTVLIKKAALGSYFLAVDGERAVRGRRVE